jgi:adenylate kinase
VPTWIIVERLSSRRICRSCGEVYNVRFLKPKVQGVCDKCGGELYQRTDDTPEVIKERLRIYEKQTQPLLEFYASKIPFVVFKCEDINIPPDVAVEDILHKLRELKIK